AHPMFGGDHGGFDASSAQRWRDGIVAVCDDDVEPEAVARVVALHRALGADVVVCSADAHDAAIAAVSHLPYVVASALSLLAEDRLRDRSPAHDFSHVARVAALARTIAEAEGADVDVVVAAAWMHEHVNLPKDHPDSARSGDLCAEAVAPILRDVGTDERFA